MTTTNNENLINGTLIITGINEATASKIKNAYGVLDTDLGELRVQINLENFIGNVVPGNRFKVQTEVAHSQYTSKQGVLIDSYEVNPVSIVRMFEKKIVIPANLPFQSKGTYIKERQSLPEPQVLEQAPQVLTSEMPF